MSLPFLQKFGLSKKESEIYELLLNSGEVPVSVVIKKTKLKRATAYKSLYALEEKGLVTKKKINKKIHFKPEPPTNLTQLAEEGIRSMERARVDLQSVLPDLLSTYIATVEKPVVTTYQGVEGLKKIYEDTLKEGQTIYAALTTAEVNSDLFKWLNRIYVKKRVKMGIKAKVIVATGKWSNQYTRLSKKTLRDTVIVPSRQFPFQHEINIYGSKVAFIDFKKGSSLIGIIIHHDVISHTMKALWKLAWHNVTGKSSK